MIGRYKRFKPQTGVELERIHRIRLSDTEIRVIERALRMLANEEPTDTVEEICLRFTQLKSALTEGSEAHLTRPRAKGMAKRR